MEEDEGFDGFSVEMQDVSVEKSGKFDRIWKAGEGGSLHQQPLIRDGIVYFGSCNHNVYAVSLESGCEVWRFRTGGIIMNTSPVECGGNIVFGSYDHNVYALDAASGKLSWKFQARDKIISHPFAAHGRVYIGSADHNVYCLDGQSGTLVWKFQTADKVTATPTESCGRVYFGSFDQNFYCVDAQDGTLQWKFQTGGEIHTMNRVLVLGGRVYFGSFDNNLYALDSVTGKEKWRLRTGQYGNYMSPVEGGGLLYHSTRDNTLLAMTPGGREMWRFQRSELLCIPLFHDGRIYAGCEDHNMYCLGSDGKEVWRFPTQGSVYIKPAASDGRLVFTSWDCNVYCVDALAGNLLWKFRSDGSPGYFPPPHEQFTLALKVKESDAQMDMGRKAAYDLGMDDEEKDGKFYKSKVTYRMSTQYASKGKYQVDSDEEAL
jgi:outer membrane protein assembly factor BamB